MKRWKKLGKPTSVYKIAATFVRTHEVGLTAEELKGLSALCEAQGLLHVLGAGSSARPSAAVAWRKLSAKLLAAVPEDAA